MPEEVTTRALVTHAQRCRWLLGLLRHPLYTNAFFLWLSTGVMAIGGFFFWALIARLYAPDQVGLASATLSAMALLTTLASLGMGMGLTRHLPSTRDQQDLINVALTIAGAAGMLAAAVFLAGLSLWSPRLSFLTRSPLYVALFVLFTGANTIGGVTPFAFMAFRGGRYILAKAAAAQVVRLAFPALLVFLGAFGIVASVGLSAIAVVVVSFVLLRSVVKSYRPALAFSRSAAAQIVPFGLANHAADLALAAPSLILPILVVNGLGATSAAHFYIGYFLAVLLLSVVQALAISLFAEGSNDEATLGHTAEHALVLAVAFSALGAGFLWVAGWKLLLLFGSGYSAESTKLLRLVALAAIPASLTYVYLAILRVQKNVKAMLTIAVVLSFATLGLSAILLPKLGVEGAGVGVLAGQGLGSALCLVHFLRVQPSHSLAALRRAEAGVA